MHNLSIVQALDVWSDLEAAYYGKNGFGGNTAEIYIYRLMPSCPLATVSPDSAIVKAAFTAANTSLYHLLEHFSTTHMCAVAIDDRPLGEWLKDADYRHRVSVRVRPGAAP